MDATGVVLRQPLRLPPSAAARPASEYPRFSAAAICVGLKRRPKNNGIKSCGFRDEGHVSYYKPNFAAVPDEERASRKKKMKKKQLKLLKGLFRDLSTFSHLTFRLDSDADLVDRVRGNMISEASEILLKELRNLKAERKERKRKMKEEKARSKATRRRTRAISSGSSSSSSESSSSDSECGEIVDMNSLEKQVVEEATAVACPVPIIPAVATPESNVVEEMSRMKKIEVCMGGKCKKSGAGALLEEFQRAVGVECAVSGCKCMGKCRGGPNVKVSGGHDGTFADKMVTTNSLCVGVRLEDVDMILESFFGGGKDSQVGFVASC